MARFVRGDVVVCPFPFSATPGFKRRPALVLAILSFEGRADYLLALISSQAAIDPHLVKLEPADIEDGTLKVVSYVRPAYMFAIDEAAARVHERLTATARTASVRRTPGGPT